MVTIAFLYDETSRVPDAIRRIIGANVFGDIVRRKRRLADTLREAIAAGAECEFERILDEAAVTAAIERIQKLPRSAMVFRLPSSVAPLSMDLFGALVAKLPYALGEAVYGDPDMADPPALLSRDNAAALLGMRDPVERQRFFRGFEQQATRVGNQVRFVDIRDVPTFLAFMSGSTEARHFNNVSQSGGVFRKHSADVAKMKAEYGYFHVVDEAMKRFLLPTFDYVEGAQGASYAMEHLSVPDAAMQLVHNTFTPASFGRLLDSFLSFIAARGQLRTSPDDVRRVATETIIGKLDQRIASLLNTDAGRHLDALLAVAGPQGSVTDLTARCRSLLERTLARSRIDHLALSHGDPCFSNILYNAEINLFRLIDPRGATTRDEALMHPLYDLAKFSHSVLGGYDYVNGGLAECRLDARMQLALTLEHGGPPEWMKQAFRTRLAEAGWPLDLLRAIEASLFLSMLPLHLDSPEKLPAFCLIAGDIIAELENVA